jgi:two-component system, cell cycle sensor histidine kinase and response regulator CckA
LIKLPGADGPSLSGRSGLISMQTVCEVIRMGHPVTVLVVDDEPTVLYIVRTVLTRDGCVVLTAADTDTALRHCREHGNEISLALIDFMMPGTDGPSLVRCLREFAPKLAVAMMSDYALETLVDRGLWNTPFIHKPFKSAQLSAFVRDELNRPATRSATS